MAQQATAQSYKDYITSCKRILMERHSIDEDTAMHVIRNKAIQTGRSMAEVAQLILTGRLADPLHKPERSPSRY